MRAAATDDANKELMTDLYHFYRINFGPWNRLEEDVPFMGTTAKPAGAGYYPTDMTEDNVPKLMHVIGQYVDYPGLLGHGDELYGDYVRGGARLADRFIRYERGQDNRHEGFYVDDVVIGFAERGEMITASAPTRSTISIGSITFPRDFDILLPSRSRPSPVQMTFLKQLEP